MASQKCFWARVPTTQAWNEWWPQVCAQFKISSDTHVEKVQGAEINWSRLMDSAKTLSLFAKQKVIVIFEAEKALKTEKDSARWIAELQNGPHCVVLQSPQTPPKGIEIKIWESPLLDGPEYDDKSSFRWIDSLHAGQLTEALQYMEAAIQAGQHPLALLQLAARDFRLGRLIHYAKENRLREEELNGKLKVSPYMIKKWAARPQLRSKQWSEIFERLWQADLELKSGNDEVWTLRKLTFDLSQLVSLENRNTNAKKLKKPSTSAQPLWPIAPSFA